MKNYEVKVVNRHSVNGGFSIQRDTPVGNPFVNFERVESIKMYATYLPRAYISDTHVHAYIDKLMDHLIENGTVTLSCTCKPKPCHGDVIKEFLLKLLNDKGVENETKIN